MTSVPPTQPPAAPESDEAYRLTEADWEALTEASFRGGAKAWRAEVERIVAERVRVVEGERDALMRASWLAYERSGADTDGDKQWHCAPEMAGRALVHAVETLRKDYDDSLDESESAEAAHRALRAIAEDIAYQHAATIDGEFGCCHDEDALRAGGRVAEFDGDEFEPIPDDCPGKQALDRHLAQIAAAGDAR